jgi:leucyl-tRNA synthetase
MRLPVDLADEDLTANALAEESVQKFVQGRPVRKVVVVKNKLVNVVI